MSKAVRHLVPALTALSAAAFVAADLANPDYDPVAETASRFVHGTAGWLIPTAIAAMAAAAALLALAVRGLGGRIALWTAATGLALAAVFRADPPGHYSAPSASEMAHGLGAWIAFTALPVAALLLSRRLGLRAAAWASVAATVVFTVFLIDVMDGPSLRIGSSESLVGLTERLAIAANLVWLALAARRSGKIRT
ncbi:DUF998 domain-containing protein [Phytomonospora sp. NPDC050363]|uniref:DUF998 domain-containing protein n=1 Tax=Phytomonospora sp. NPDC050363 TaxID=3155642 RepID=UPI0033CE91BE